VEFLDLKLKAHSSEALNLCLHLPSQTLDTIQDLLQQCILRSAFFCRLLTLLSQPSYSPAELSILLDLLAALGTVGIQSTYDFCDCLLISGVLQIHARDCSAGLLVLQLEGGLQFS